MRLFVVEFGNNTEILSLEGFRNFIATAVFNNKDISCFKVTEVDDRLSFEQAMMLAYSTAHAYRFITKYRETGDIVEAFTYIYKHKNIPCREQL